MRDQLRIQPADVEAVSDFLTGPGNRLVDGLLDLVDRYGGVEEINRAADEAGRLENRLARLQDEGSPFLAGLEWLTEQRDAGAFVDAARVPAQHPRRRRGRRWTFDEANAVTLEISALQYFPWLIAEAEQAIERRELMPGRYIRVRNMAEQAGAGEDILAVAAAMQIIGATHVETLDTQGHRRQQRPPRRPGDDHRLLRRHRPAQRLPAQVGRRVPPLPHRVRHPPGAQHQQRHHPGRPAACTSSASSNEFKVSVFMGVDNPWSVLWLLMGARLLAGEDGSTSMAGLNLSNSVELPTLLSDADVRRGLGFEDDVRFEHHVTET